MAKQHRDKYTPTDDWTSKFGQLVAYIRWQEYGGDISPEDANKLLNSKENGGVYCEWLKRCLPGGMELAMVLRPPGAEETMERIKTQLVEMCPDLADEVGRVLGGPGRNTGRSMS